MRETETAPHLLPCEALTAAAPAPAWSIQSVQEAGTRRGAAPAPVWEPIRERDRAAPVWESSAEARARERAQAMNKRRAARARAGGRRDALRLYIAAIAAGFCIAVVGLVWDVIDRAPYFPEVETITEAIPESAQE